MKNKIRPKQLLQIAIFTIAIGSLVIFVPWSTLLVWIQPLPNNVQKQINTGVGHGLAGIIVYVEKQGKPPEYFAAGWNNKENKVPANPHTLFKIASISKLYIAAAAAKLASTGTVDLDKTLAEYLPELVGRIKNAPTITLRMLLKHRSGIPDFIDHPNMPWANLPANTNEYLNLVLDSSPNFEPNNSYQYSNTNYLLVGKILDKVLGYNHQQYIKTAILNPLGLENTFGELSEVNLAALSSGYYTEYDGDLKSQNYICPGGSMVANLQDVGTFLRALNNGALFTQDEQAIYSSIYPYDHTGLLPGYSSIARYYKDIDSVVIVFVNTSGGNSWATIEVVYNRIVKILRKNN
ncbi:MAG TPA: serine hydrolase domain-containing protein [Saprospiraceae bacterium]|nr:serine hydrolase domain-containing protein [Saprospiraceae bacterium]HPN68978.1 serine hydrolase domain-containing protein [Saprospiraceae bacterium]